MMALRQEKHLLRCLRWVAAELNGTSGFRTNRWRFNARCFASQDANKSDKEKAVEEINMDNLTRGNSLYIHMYRLCTCQAGRKYLAERLLKVDGHAMKGVHSDLEVISEIKEEKLKKQWAEERKEQMQFKTTHYCVPTPFEKRLLVWYGSFKSIEEVPDLVSISQMLNVKDKIRAKAAVFLTIVTAVIAWLVIRSSQKEFDSFWDHEALKVQPDFDKSKPLMVSADQKK